jgi:hypothetical protein
MNDHQSDNVMMVMMVNTTDYLHENDNHDVIELLEISSAHIVWKNEGGLNVGIRRLMS